jgi:hypothetical protein
MMAVRLAAADDRDRRVSAEMRGCAVLGLLAMVLAAAAPVCHAQGIVEAGALAGAASAAGQAAKGVGAAAGKAFEKTGGTLSQGGKTRPKTAAVESSTSRPLPAETPRRIERQRITPTREAFEKVTVGMDWEEVRSLLGPPSSRLVVPEEGKLVEIHRYRTGQRELGRLRVVDGKVTEVLPAGQ